MKNLSTILFLISFCLVAGEHAHAFRGRRSGGGGTTYAAPSDSLIRAGHGGSPGFQIRVHYATHSAHTCQATLVARNNGLCIAATAAHCIFIAGKKVFPSARMEALEGELPIEMPSFGKVIAHTFRDPRMTQFANAAPYDNAAFVFRCDENSEVPVVPVGKPIQEEEPVHYAKVMRLPGLWKGICRKHSADRRDRITAANVQPNAGQPFSDFGDSGGGLYRKVENGFELVGIHSGTLIYSTDLEFVENVVAEFF